MCTADPRRPFGGPTAGGGKMMNRRRFLTIAAASLAAPVEGASPVRWQGRALGAEVSLELSGPEEVARRAIKAALHQVRRIEQLFSLYDPNSALVRLNTTGFLTEPDPEMLKLFRLADKVHRETDGLFDPTVQALWSAYAQGTPVRDARKTVGWPRVEFASAGISLATGQSLTFNGIAQGFATDLVSDVLRTHGLTDIHVNMGEQLVAGRTRRLGVLDPEHGVLGNLSLTNMAVSTSSPGLLPLGSEAFHILSPRAGKPLWSTVSVVAKSAALADGYSTALCLGGIKLARHVRAKPGVERILLVDAEGDLTTL